MNIQNIALKAKNTIINNTVGRVITTAHRKGDLSATSDSFVIRGISKNGKPINYQKKNPFSTDHWDIKAAEAGQLNKLYQSINNYLRR